VWGSDCPVRGDAPLATSAQSLRVIGRLTSCVSVVNEAGRRAEVGLSVISVVQGLGQRWSGEIPAVKRPKPEADCTHYIQYLTYGPLAELYMLCLGETVYFLSFMARADCYQRHVVKLSKRMESGLASASGAA